MFKDFERIAKENKPAAATTGEKAKENASTAEDPFAKMFAGMGDGENLDDAQMMNMFKGLLGGIGGGEGQADGGPNDNQMDEIMKQFTGFLQDTDANGEFKGALDSVVKEIISKDSLYKPMNQLKQEMPGWLEENW